MRLINFLKEDATKQALELDEPEVGRKYDEESVKKRIDLINKALKDLRGKKGLDDDAKEAMMNDLNDKLDKWENVDKETEIPKPPTPEEKPPEEKEAEEEAEAEEEEAEEAEAEETEKEEMEKEKEREKEELDREKDRIELAKRRSERKKRNIKRREKMQKEESRLIKTKISLL